MNKEDLFKFTNSIILLSQIISRVEDKFLKQKLYDKVLDFTFSFVEYESEMQLVLYKQDSSILKNIPKSDNTAPRSANVAQRGFRNTESIAKPVDIVQRDYVAQYQYQNLCNSINNLVDYLEYLAHISKTHATPLLMSHMAQRNLLKLKFHILKQTKNEKKVGDILKKEENFSEVAVIPLIKNKIKTKLSDQPIKLKSNKEKIFNFIKKFPDVRTKEIIDEFSALSGRTVKRNLKELTEEGLLKKKSDGAAVYYFISE